MLEATKQFVKFSHFKLLRFKIKRKTLRTILASFFSVFPSNFVLLVRSKFLFSATNSKYLFFLTCFTYFSWANPRQACGSNRWLIKLDEGNRWVPSWSAWENRKRNINIKMWKLRSKWVLSLLNQLLTMILFQLFHQLHARLSKPPKIFILRRAYIIIFINLWNL